MYIETWSSCSRNQVSTSMGLTAAGDIGDIGDMGDMGGMAHNVWGARALRVLLYSHPFWPPSPVTFVPCTCTTLRSAGIPENRYKQRVFVLACSFTVFVLVVFFTALFLQYETLRKTTFISVEESDGCKPVLATINDHFRFDQLGNWETSSLVRIVLCLRCNV